MSHIANALRIAWQMLREIFDEAAYTRFLERNQMSSSPGAYNLFLQERESAIARRARCC